MTEPSVTISKTEKPNSFEFGKAGSRFKLYFDTPQELIGMIAELTALGLLNMEAQNGKVDNSEN